MTARNAHDASPLLSTELTPTTASKRSSGSPDGPQEPATWWVRVQAQFIDYAVAVVLFFGLAFLAGMAVAYATGADEPFWIALVGGALSAVLGTIVYQLVGDASGSGQTVGRRAMGIRAVKAGTAQPLGFGRALGRNLARPISGIPLDLGYLAPLWDRRRRTFHDTLAGTEVVHGTKGPVATAITSAIAVALLAGGLVGLLWDPPLWDAETVEASDPAIDQLDASCVTSLPSDVNDVAWGDLVRVQVEVDIPSCWPEGETLPAGATWNIRAGSGEPPHCSGTFNFDTPPKPGTTHRLLLKFSDCELTPGEEVTVETDSNAVALESSTAVVRLDDENPPPTTTAPASSTPQPASPAQDHSLTEVRTGEHGTYSRLVFEFGSGSTPDANVSISGTEMTVSLSGSIGGPMAQNIQDTNRLGVPQATEGGSKWLVSVPTGATSEDSWLTGPNRLVVDVSGPTFGAAPTPTPSPATAPSYSIAEIRTGDNGSRNRVVFEFASSVPPHRINGRADGTYVEFDVSGVISGPASTDMKSSVITDVRRYSSDTNTWVISGSSNGITTNVEELDGPPRLVIDF
ncbi:MAG: RDD family protein [Microthrixaceae bacterium]